MRRHAVWFAQAAYLLVGFGVLGLTKDSPWLQLLGGCALVAAVLCLGCLVNWAEGGGVREVSHVTQTIDITQRPGESAELLTTRIVDALSQDTGWMR